MEEKKVHTVSIRVGAELKVQLEQLANADDRTLSAYINRVLRQHVEAANPKPTKG